MYFYRNPGWGFGMRILMVVLLIAGIGFVAKTSFQAGLMQGAALEGGEITIPYFAPYAKGFMHPVWGGSFFPVFAVFLGGILLIKLISSIVGLVMFNRWRKEKGDDWESMGPWHFHKFRGHWAPCHPGPWDAYPIKRKGGPEAIDQVGEEESADS